MDSYQVYDLAADAIEETEQGLRATPNDLPVDFQARLYTQNQEGALFKVIDPATDVDWTHYSLAQKTAKVHAERVPPGTEVETIMADGHHGTTKTAGAEGGYRVTNPDGEQYLAEPDKFTALYDKTNVDGVYQPKPDPRKVLPVDQNVAFTASWGKTC